MEAQKWADTIMYMPAQEYYWPSDNATVCVNPICAYRPKDGTPVW